MALSRSIVAPLLLVVGLASSSAHAQVAKVAYTDDDDDPFGNRNTDAGLSVNDQAVLTTANMRISLFDRSGTLLDTRQVGGTNPTPWPFQRVDTGGGVTFGPSRFFDPQTVYHPQSDRLWMIYSEENLSGGTTGASGNPVNNLSAIHLAVSQEMAGTDVLDTFGTQTDEDWWYYTGSSGARPYFNLRATMGKYRDEDPDLHTPFRVDGSGLVDKPHMAVDERAAYITMNGNDFAGAGGNFNAILIIPTSHGTTGNPLSGHRTRGPGDRTRVAGGPLRAAPPRALSLENSLGGCCGVWTPPRTAFPYSVTPSLRLRALVPPCLCDNPLPLFSQPSATFAFDKPRRPGAHATYHCPYGQEAQETPPRHDREPQGAARV